MGKWPVLETLLTLFVAHVLADFVLQTPWILDNKRHWKGFGLHILIVGLTAWLFTAAINPWPLMVIVVSHALTDWAKLAWINGGNTPEAKKARDGFWPFLIDQLVHLAFIVCVAIAWPSTVSTGGWGGLPAEQQRLLFQAFTVIGGVALSVAAGGIFIDKLLAGFGPHRITPSGPSAGQPPQTQAPSSTSQDGLGLPGGGQAIGWLERAVALLLILIGQPEGVGLLLAAKSILRFSDAHARANTEYVIIGTLLSFGWAIASAVLTRAALLHWGG